jgi:hypothetical protein
MSDASSFLKFPCDLRIGVFFSAKRRAHEPTFTDNKEVKRGDGTSVGAMPRPLVWLDASQEAIQRGAEVARLALGGQAGQDATVVEGGAPPLAPLVEAIPISREETRVANAPSALVSPTVSDLLRAIPDTSKATRSPEAANVEEVDPSRRPGESVEEHIVPPPTTGAGGDLVHVGPNLSTWGGPTLMWMATDGIRTSSSTTPRRSRCGSSFRRASSYFLVILTLIVCLLFCLAGSNPQ